MNTSSMKDKIETQTKLQKQNYSNPDQASQELCLFEHVVNCLWQMLVL